MKKECIQDSRMIINAVQLYWKSKNPNLKGSIIKHIVTPQYNNKLYERVLLNANSNAQFAYNGKSIIKITF